MIAQLEGGEINKNERLPSICLCARKTEMRHTQPHADAKVCLYYLSSERNPHPPHPPKKSISQWDALLLPRVNIIIFGGITSIFEIEVIPPT